MVERYPHNIWTRSKWQEERTVAAVPRGACPTVSIAEELDRFHRSVAHGVSPAATSAAFRLTERARAYVASVRSRYPNWANRVTAQIADRALAVHEEFDKIGKAREQFNKAVLMVKQAFEPAESDIEHWMDAGENTRLNSRSVDILVAGLREVYVQGQRLTYITDRLDQGVWNDARRLWSVMDGRRQPDRLWLEGVNDLRVRLRPA